MSRKKILPYEIKVIDGKKKYHVGEGRWVSRQRAHQIFQGYTSNRNAGPAHLVSLSSRAREERIKYGIKEETTE